ncbi:MAG: hydantoinase/oxoprolinase family protein, partial [Natronomonas sp.]|nr:hydantoinase/oxoprolinase family protein [Natronomonas sp.]
PVEAVHLRVRGIGTTEKPELAAVDVSGAADPHLGSREAYCFAERETVEFGEYDRDGLAPGTTVAGPAIVREPTTSIVFHSDQRATVDEYGHLVIEGVDR